MSGDMRLTAKCPMRAVRPNPLPRVCHPRGRLPQGGPASDLAASLTSGPEEEGHGKGPKLPVPRALQARKTGSHLSDRPAAPAPNAPSLLSAPQGRAKRGAICSATALAGAVADRQPQRSDQSDMVSSVMLRAGMAVERPDQPPSGLSDQQGRTICRSPVKSGQSAVQTRCPMRARISFSKRKVLEIRTPSRTSAKTP
jgi:hypothetical protein